MAANNQGQPPKLDRYVVIHAATTCDEHGVYVTKDSAEVIELGWILLDAKTCEEVRSTPIYDRPQAPTRRHVTRHSDSCKTKTTDGVVLQITRDSILVKPVNTPITPLCSE